MQIDGLRAGSSRSYLGRQTWLWSVTDLALVQAGPASSGNTETLDDARQASREAFGAWQAWALAHAGSIHWIADARQWGRFNVVDLMVPSLFLRSLNYPQVSNAGRSRWRSVGGPLT